MSFDICLLVIFATFTTYVSICHGEGGGLMNKLAKVQADNNALSDTLDSPRVPLVDHPACKDDLIELHKSCHATKQVLIHYLECTYSS